MAWEGVQWRLQWAHGRWGELKGRVDAYKALPPYSVQEEVDPAGGIVARAELVHDPPIEISLALSDALHQYRAVLDNLVGALRKGGPSSRSAFPLAETAEAFDELADGRRYLEAVPTWARHAIRSLQPFTDNPMGWHGATLMHLHELARRDRHRALTVSAAIVEPSRFEGTMGEQPIPLRFIQLGPRVAEVRHGPPAGGRAFFSASVVLVEDLPGLVEPDVLALAGDIASSVSTAVSWIREHGRRTSDQA